MASKNTKQSSKGAPTGSRARTAAKTPAAKTPAAKTPAAKTPAAKTPAKGAGRDAFGRRLNSGAHFVCVALASAKGALHTGEIVYESSRLATAAGVRARDAISAQLNSMVAEQLVSKGADGWALTPRGRKLWSAGKPTTRRALVAE